MVKIGNNGLPLETTYFDTEICAKGFYYLVHNMDKYFLFLPKWNERVLKEMETGKNIVITRGNHNGKNDCFEIMFDDNSDNPYMIILEDEQFTRLSPLKEGWNGTFYVYSGDLEAYKLYFSNVYYRITDNLPFLEPVEEQIEKLHNLTPLNHDEAIIALKAGERLVNGENNYDVAHYHWYEGSILKSDSYYDLVGEGTTIPENDLPQLYRMGDGIFGNMAIHVKTKLKPLLESNNFPLLLKKFDLEKLTEQLVSICSKTGKNLYNTNFEIILTQLEKSLG
jgi:hypothetical protein